MQDTNEAKELHRNILVNHMMKTIGLGPTSQNGLVKDYKEYQFLLGEGAVRELICDLVKTVLYVSEQPGTQRFSDKTVLLLTRNLLRLIDREAAIAYKQGRETGNSLAMSVLQIKPDKKVVCSIAKQRSVEPMVNCELVLEDGLLLEPTAAELLAIENAEVN